MIPGKSEWTVIFSKNSTSAGSFSNDPKEDALRVTEKTVDGPFHEALTFEFTDLAADGALVCNGVGEGEQYVNMATTSHHHHHNNVLLCADCFRSQLLASALDLARRDPGKAVPTYHEGFDHLLTRNVLLWWN